MSAENISAEDLNRVFGRYVNQYIGYNTVKVPTKDGSSYSEYTVDESRLPIIAQMRRDAERIGLDLRVLHPGMDHPVMLEITGRDEKRVNIPLEHVSGNTYKVAPNFFIG